MVEALTQVSAHTFHFQEPVRKELEPVQRDEIQTLEKANMPAV